MSSLVQDLRFGLRLWKSGPAFAIVAVLTLALGIGAATTVFSWVDGILLRPFPGASNPGDLAFLEAVVADAPNGGNSVSYLDAGDFRKQMRSISGLALRREDVFSVGDDTGAQAVWGELVSGGYFDLLGVKMAMGRAFSAEESDDRQGVHQVAVISHALWRRYFESDPKVLGRSIRLNRHELTVIGVAAPEFHGTMPGLVFDLWVPLTMGGELNLVPKRMFTARGIRNVHAIVRMKPGISAGQAGGEAETVARALAAAWPKTNSKVSARVIPTWMFRSGAPDLLLRPLLILTAFAALMLLVVCANVANLLLARSLARRREFGIRRALGAGFWRLSRQMLIETLLLALAAALVGLPMALWMSELLALLVPSVGVTVVLHAAVNVRLLLFTTGCAVAAALIAGMAPALFWRRQDVHETLKDGGRSGTSGVSSHRMRSLLVASEVALASVALIGAGLFLRSFEQARRIHPGFDRDNMLLARFYIATSGYSDKDLFRFCEQLRQRLAGAPGVKGSGYSNFAPLGATAGPWDSIEVEGYLPAPGEAMSSNRSDVGPGYFDLLRTPLLEGRDFSLADHREAPPVVIVNEAFARRYFAGRSPVGRKLLAHGKLHTVVGLAKDAKHFNVAEPPRPHLYAPFLQRGSATEQLYFFVKTTGDSKLAAASLRRTVAELDRNAAAFHLMPLTAWTEITLLPQKMAASLLGALGLLSVLVAAAGLYSVMAYAVTQRTQELGIRVAMGARPGDVLRVVLSEGLTLTALGLAAGALASLALGRLVSNMLVNVGLFDLPAFGGAALFLAVVALAACLLPALRAARVDPMVALRCQ